MNGHSHVCSEDCVCKRDYDEQLLLKYVPWFDKLFHSYFCARVVNEDNIPSKKEGEPPVIFIANHSGMTLPWDILMAEFCIWDIYRKRGVPFSRRARSLASHALSDISAMCLFSLKNIWRRIGVVDATYKNFGTMMTHTWDLLFCPEGIDGISKGFAKRYQLQRFSSSFVRMAHKHKATIVPISIVNAEYLVPFAFRLKTVDFLAKALFRLPFVSISPLTSVGLVFPFAAYSVLPARLTYVFGKPIQIEISSAEKITAKTFQSLADSIQASMQAELNVAVKTYGQAPLRVKGFLKSLKWSSTATEIWMRHDAEKSNTRYSRIKHGFRVLCYFVPILGWALLNFRLQKKHDAPWRQKTEKGLFT